MATTSDLARVKLLALWSTGAFYHHNCFELQSITCIFFTYYASLIIILSAKHRRMCMQGIPFSKKNIDWFAVVCPIPS